jgi:anion-transporting  ArsA/GET3 family ATPase
MAESPRPSPSLEELLGVRMLIVTGKGGVGKTTVAAALARLAASRGRKVLAAEIGAVEGAAGPLHAALLGKDTGARVEPSAVAPNLDVALLTPESGHRAFLREVLPLGALADRALKTAPVSRFLAAAPAFSELGILYRGLTLLEEQRRGRARWDLVVVDAPATGHALAFTTLPGVMLRIVPGGPLGRAMREGLELLTDPARTKAVVTTLPETLPVSETFELIAGLQKSRVNVGGVIANQVPHDPFSPLEHATLADFLLGRGPADGAGMLGTRSLEKLRRARGAVERLEEKLGALLMTVQEQAHRGPALVEAVARELGRSPDVAVR